MGNERENPAPSHLRSYLDARSEAAFAKVFDFLAKIEEPTTVSEIARKTGAAKPTIVKALKRILEEGSLGLIVKKVGKYDLIYKKEVVKDGSQTGSSEGRGSEPGRSSEA